MQQANQQQQQQQQAGNPLASLLQQINLTVQVSVLQDVQQDQSTSVAQSQSQSQSQGQSQQQQQQQRQRQRQHQKGPPREIIPEPPALVLGLVGLSFLVWQLSSRGRRLGPAPLDRTPLP